jgi:hypothetical protein
MHYMVIWEFGPDHSLDATARFMETGAQPPEGAIMHSRWHDVAANRGFAITETDDVTNIAKWVRQWHDLLSFEIVPVINDEQMAEVLS